LAAADANFLVLDEPTNHLDLWARDALEEALKAFDGTVLFVSHDRYFVNQVADHLLVVEPNRVVAIEGNYEDYQLFLKSKAAIPPNGPAATAPAKAAAGQVPQSGNKQAAKGGKQSREAGDAKPSGAAAKTKTKRFPFRKASDIEADIFQHETLIAQITEELADQATYRNGNRVRELKQSLAQEKTVVKQLYEHWEEASESKW
jgi:ATP-binding cassette subfamily F protein 3